MSQTTKILKIGDKSEHVKNVQALLKSAGYSLTIDGNFGKETDFTVKDFQGSKGLKPDGIVGSKTWEHLLKISQQNS